jgi:hypothetical protein
MILYIILGVIIFFILVHVYIRLAYKFWSCQPVFHSWNILYRLKPPGIIDKKKPEQNKFCNLTNIKLKKFSELNDFDHNYNLEKIVTFIQNNTLADTPLELCTTSKHILPYLENHNLEVYISLYTEPQLLMDWKNRSTILDENTMGLISSRPLYMTNLNSSMIIYLIDFLCTKKDKKKRDITFELIQTHIYRQIHTNSKFMVFCFKKNQEIPGIIPLLEYKSYGFKLHTNKINSAYSQYQIIEINNHNIQFFLATVKENKSKFILTLTPHLSNLCELLQTNNISIYQLQHAKQTVSIYIFKNSGNKYKNENCIECIGSVKLIENMDVFLCGFQLACEKIKEKYNSQYLQLDHISDNYHIYDNIIKNIKSVFVQNRYFYLYNYNIETIKAKDSFILL